LKSTILELALQNKFVLIAEIGVNYYDIAKKNKISPMEAAKLMIQEAKESGIHAVKFQTYKADTLAAKESPSYWDTSEEVTTSQFELFKKYDAFSLDEYKELHAYCNEINIEFLSTAFDFESADYLYDLMEVYKISSSDLNNIPFVSYQAKKGKSIILSAGASTEMEIEETLRVIRKYNNEPIILMHCVLEYPTPYSHANLNRIVALKNRFENVIIGYSDHTKPDSDSDIIKTAYNLGAIVVEKHFTLDKSLPGNDHYHAMDPSDAAKIIKGIEFIDETRGSYAIEFQESESGSRRNARRSIVANCEISKGEIFTEEMLTFKRPGTGISPAKISSIIGKKAKIDIGDDTILKLEMIE
jgi:sialic acid synthase SpsE